MKTVQLAIVLLLTIGHQCLTAQNNLANKATAQMENLAYAQAIETWSRALSLEANNEHYFFKRGYCNLKLNRCGNALDDFTAALHNDPKNPEYVLYRAIAYYENKDYGNAKWAFEDALKANPDNIACFLYKIKNYVALGEYQIALVDCKKMLKSGDVNNPNAEILMQRALLYQITKQLPLAERELKEAIKFTTNTAAFYGNLGTYYKNAKDYTQATTAFSKAHQLDKTNLSYTYEYACLSLQGNDIQGAYEKSTALMQGSNALQLYTKGLVVRATSAALLNKQNIYENALRDFTAHAENVDDFVFIANTFLTHLYDTSKYPEALKQAKYWAIKATEMLDNHTHNLLLSEIYLKLDETTLAEETATKAVSMLQKIKEADGEKKYAAELLVRVKEANGDKTAPILTILSPTQDVRGGVIVEGIDEITIVGMARDDSGTTKVLINGNIAKLDADGSFEGKTALQGDNNKIMVQAYDKKGNMSEKLLVIEKAKATPIPAKKDLATVSTQGKNYALLFGNNVYNNWGELYNPINDAKAFAKDLESIYGFTTEVVENCTQEQFILKIREYIEKSYNDNDQVLIFYAGHGKFDETFKKGCLVLKDSEDRDAKTMTSYISYNDLRSFISAIPSKHVLYIADACFSGTIDEKVAMRGARDDIFKNRQDYINRIMSYTTRMYITSGGKEYVPDGKPGGHSPFMRKMLEIMRSEGGNDGILTFGEIKAHIDGTKPTPHFGELDSNEPGSDFIFIKK